MVANIYLLFNAHSIIYDNKYDANDIHYLTMYYQIW